jgi:hypothetical protein
MQQDHASVPDAEQNPSNSVAQGGTHLAKALSKRPACRHSDRPAELNRLEVRSNPESILFVQEPQPTSNRLRSSRGAEEDRRDALQVQE